MNDDLKLRVVFTGSNQTGTAFSTLNRATNNYQHRLAKYQRAQRSLFSIGNLAAVGGAVGLYKLGSQLEKTRVGFEVMTGSAKKANSLIYQINQQANATPYMNKDLLKSAELLLGFGVAQEKVLPYMRSLGDIARGDSNRLQQLSLAFAQSQSAGKLMGQDLLQMVNAGFNPLLIMSDKTGKSIGVLRDEMGKGQISASMVAEAFTDATREGGKYYNMSERMSKTASGKLSTAMGKTMDTLAIASERSMPAVADLLDEMLPLIDAFSRWTQQNPETMTSILKVTGVMIGGTGAIKVINLMRAGVLLNTAAIQRMTIAMAANPWGIALVTAVGLGAAIYALSEQYNGLNIEQQAMRDVTEAVNKKMSRETSEMNLLFRTLKVTNPESERRNKAVEELRQKYPDLLRGYNLEKGSLEEIEAAQNKATASLRDRIRLEIIKEKLIETGRKKFDLEMERQDIKENGAGWFENLALGVENYGPITSAWFGVRDKKLDGFAIDRVSNEIAVQTKRENKLYRVNDALDNQKYYEQQEARERLPNNGNNFTNYITIKVDGHVSRENASRLAYGVAGEISKNN